MTRSLAEAARPSRATAASAELDVEAGRVVGARAAAATAVDPSAAATAGGFAVRAARDVPAGATLCKEAVLPVAPVRGAAPAAESAVPSLGLPARRSAPAEPTAAVVRSVLTAGARVAADPALRGCAGEPECLAALGAKLGFVALVAALSVASLRISEADARGRHRGVSHHSLTAYGRVALAPADVVVPSLPGFFGERVRDQAWNLGERHTLVEVSVQGLEDEVRALPVKVSTMGRGLGEDRAAFLSAAAAGRHAATLIDG